MKFIPKKIAFLLLCLHLVLSAPAMAQNQDGYIELIDGVSLNGWNIVGNASWVIGKGNIEGNKPMGFLVKIGRAHV